MLDSMVVQQQQNNNPVSDFIISFSSSLQLELKHLDSGMIELSLLELQPRGGKTLLAIQRIPIEQLEEFLQAPVQS